MKLRSILVLLALAMGLLLTACGGLMPTPQVIVVTATPEPEAAAEEAPAEEAAEGAEAEDDVVEPAEEVAEAGDTEAEPAEDGGTTDTQTPMEPVAEGPKPAVDAGRIAFMGPYGEGLQSFLINPDGSGLTLISEEDAGGTFFPSLTPDGDQVAFVAERGGNPDIYVKDIATGEITQLTEEPGLDYLPRFSPDGSRIAFISDRAGNLDVWVMDADGENAEALTATPEDEELGGWSPDGQTLLFTRKEANDQNIWTIDLESGEETRLTDADGVNAGPVYSPDGELIAFYSNEGEGTLNIYTMTAEGEEVTQLTEGSGDSLFPIFSPDGEWIAYSAVQGQSPALVVIPTKGGRPVLLNEEVLGLPTSWQPADEPLEETGLTQGPGQENVEVSETVLATAPSKGDPDAPVTIIEFSDYQCPFCKRFVDETLPGLEPYIESGQVRFVWVDFPLQIHPQAPEASRAARCAAEQGDDAYWTMHDIIFAMQDRWSGQEDPTEIFGDLAEQAGLDGDAVVACLESGEYTAEVEAGLQEGLRLQVSGTPTFFINGTRLVGAQPLEAFTPLIEAGLE